MVLIEILVSSPPESLALLRLAFSRRATNSKAPSAKSKTLDEAVLTAFSANPRLRQAWELALSTSRMFNRDGQLLTWTTDLLEGEWIDAQTDSSEDKAKLLREDLEQLKVALRKGGQPENV